uniref:Uncharacterized protein n=1 Tax=Candidatus Kentrum sp. FM TaxID=2126340 RepID=A0A450TG63_9GAMM|nr:MAG: hypothetical protein BECKFM1743C_GA0114222_104161 [Candidatus Kentron sp. FM]VFJ66290.1 MAG: hypothetical protein BECKFM1743A_GA0114220_104076 [Candidatus Kentron sp. FM]VFK09244.1 MAG: hypothetical protein BECKFM1743B_GA0114221_100993 [Candidatus Kentron sp. FM]
MSIERLYKVISVKEYTSLLVLLPSFCVAMTVTSGLSARHCNVRWVNYFLWGALQQGLATAGDFFTASDWKPGG